MKVISSFKSSKIQDCNEKSMYSYKTFIGKHKIKVRKGDSVWMVNTKDDTVVTIPGPVTVDSLNMAVVIRGYNSGYRVSSINAIGTNLPYVNGCSTHQLIHPIRPGDPTFQHLLIPKGCSEQAHHVHSTDRVCYVFKGSGQSIQGLKGQIKKDLNKGDVIVLDKMVPHHFETEKEDLIVLPLHIFSSNTLEHDHPMFNGTFKV